MYTTEQIASFADTVEDIAKYIKQKHNLDVTLDFSRQRVSFQIANLGEHHSNSNWPHQQEQPMDLLEQYIDSEATEFFLGILNSEIKENITPSVFFKNIANKLEKTHTTGYNARCFTKSDIYKRGGYVYKKENSPVDIVSLHMCDSKELSIFIKCAFSTDPFTKHKVKNDYLHSSKPTEYYFHKEFFKLCEQRLNTKIFLIKLFTYMEEQKWRLCFNLWEKSKTTNQRLLVDNKKVLEFLSTLSIKTGYDEVVFAE